jgi:hypothetical protein
MVSMTKYTKVRAEYLLDCMHTGKPIAPSGEDWTADDLLALAGACRFVATEHPISPSGVPLATLSVEQREALAEILLADVTNAIGYYHHLTDLVANDGYLHTPVLIGKVAADGKDGRQVAHFDATFA